MLSGGERSRVLLLLALRPASGIKSSTLFYTPNGARGFGFYQSRQRSVISTERSDELASASKIFYRRSPKSQHEITKFYRTRRQSQHFEKPHASQVTQPSLKRSAPWQSGQITLYWACCHWIPRASSRGGARVPVRSLSECPDALPFPPRRPFDLTPVFPFPLEPLVFPSDSRLYSPISSALRPS